MICEQPWVLNLINRPCIIRSLEWKKPIAFYVNPSAYRVVFEQYVLLISDHCIVLACHGKYDMVCFPSVAEHEQGSKRNHWWGDTILSVATSGFLFSSLCKSVSRSRCHSIRRILNSITKPNPGECYVARPAHITRMGCMGGAVKPNPASCLMHRWVQNKQTPKLCSSPRALPRNPLINYWKRFTNTNCILWISDLVIMRVAVTFH